MLIDSHTHLYWDDFQADIDEVVAHANAAGVEAIVNIGVDVATSNKAVSWQHPKITAYSSIGIHPHEAGKYAHNFDELIAQDLAELEAIYREYPDKVIAVGECGLDYFFEGNPDYVPTDLTIGEVKQLQKKLLIAQVELAKKLDLPLIIHCRDDRSTDPNNTQCWDDCLEIVGDWKGILHCYSGLDKTTQKAQTIDFLVSFAANITYPKNEYLREAIKHLPLEKIVLETDCPFLGPQVRKQEPPAHGAFLKRGSRNEPVAIYITAQLISQLKEVSFDQVANQTTTNIKKMLKLP